MTLDVTSEVMICSLSIRYTFLAPSLPFLPFLPFLPSSLPPSLPPSPLSSLPSLLPQRTCQQKVIIMELCTGGSLYEVIDSPENAYGLGENEFKQVIYDVGE